jgi:hypothetical protein
MADQDSANKADDMFNGRTGAALSWSTKPAREILPSRGGFGGGMGGGY